MLRPHARIPIWVCILIALYIISFSFFCSLKFLAFSYHDFDLAVYVQALWNLLHGSLYSSILDISILGNHFVPILFLVVPFYAIFPSPLTLLFLQSFLLGGGAWFVYRIGLKILDPEAALAVVFAYLLYPALGFINLFEFHPVAFAVFFLLGALEAFEREHVFHFLAFILLALLCQEDVSLAVAALGIYGGWRKRPPFWILTPLILGVSWFCMSVLWLMPRWNPGIIDYSILYSHLGRTPQEACRFILLHPVKTLSLIVGGEAKKTFILQLLLPIGFLPLLDPKSFFLALPGFLEQLLSGRKTQHLLNYHYTVLLIPFLFFASIHGMKRLFTLKRKVFLRRGLLGLFIGLSLFSAIGFGPLGSASALWGDVRRTALDRKRQQLIQSLPSTASVVATFEFLPHLGNRRHLYSLHHVCMGRYTLSEKPYLLPEAIDALLIDFNDPLTLFFIGRTAEADRRLAQFLKGWKVREAFGDLVYFERGEGPFLVKQVSDFSTKYPLKVEVDQTLLLRGLKGFPDKARRGEVFSLTFSWECLASSSKSYGLLLSFLDHNKRLLAQQYHPIGYRVLPTFRWKKGERFEETYSLVPPDPARGETSYELRISYVDERGAQTVPIVLEGETVEHISFGMIEATGG